MRSLFVHTWHATSSRLFPKNYFEIRGGKSAPANAANGGCAVQKWKDFGTVFKEDGAEPTVNHTLKLPPTHWQTPLPKFPAHI